ncbi:MAG: DUF1127 domain-containing protein [Hyphomicrobiales bacterium]|nr:DUF1127 domain-containing protein [Hyphomicrobiales bacterium]
MKPNQYVAQFDREHQTSRENKIGVFGDIVQKIESYLDTRRERRELLTLDDHMLHDIGLNRGEAERIADKPFNWFANKSKS